MFSTSPVVSPGVPANGTSPLPDQRVNPDEAALTAQLKAQHTAPQVAYGHMRTVQPLGAQMPAPTLTQPAGATAQPQSAISLPANAAPVVAVPTDSPQPAVPVTATPDPAILSLANNNDLNVATLARQAQKAKSDEGMSDGEVVISLR